MPKRPVVVYFDLGLDSNQKTNDYREAVGYWLKEKSDCELIVYGWWKAESRIAQLAEQSPPILIIIETSGMLPLARSIIRLARNAFSDSFPIVVIVSGFDNGDKIPPEKNLLICDYLSSSRVFDLVSQLVAKLKPKSNWFGAYTVEQQELLADQLENAYRFHYPDDERMLGTPDRNHMIVVEAIRLRLLPAECRKSEFDDTLKLTSQGFDPVESSVYTKETERIFRMSDEERDNLLETMLHAEGYERTGEGTTLTHLTNCAKTVNGFAIDPITMERWITYNQGEHKAAREWLTDRIKMIEMLRKVYRWTGSKVEKGDIYLRIISGFIFTIDGFETPILRLNSTYVNLDRLHKVNEDIKKRRQFIPITRDGYLIES